PTSSPALSTLSLHDALPIFAQQPVFRPVSRRDIMAAVNTCGRNLGIRQGTVIVLDALLSCLPCQGADGREAPVTPATLLTIYARDRKSTRLNSSHVKISYAV